MLSEPAEGTPSALAGLFTRSVRGDWLAGVNLLQSALDISVRNVRINLAGKVDERDRFRNEAILQEAGTLKNHCSEAVAKLNHDDYM